MQIFNWQLLMPQSYKTYKTSLNDLKCKADSLFNGPTLWRKSQYAVGTPSHLLQLDVKKRNIVIIHNSMHQGCYHYHSNITSSSIFLWLLTNICSCVQWVLELVYLFYMDGAIYLKQNRINWLLFRTRNGCYKNKEDLRGWTGFVKGYSILSMVTYISAEKILK